MSQDIDVIFNGTDLEEGTYNAVIQITHDGQSTAKGVVQIPVTLHVSGDIVIPGDANGDGTVDILDLTAIAYYILDLNPEPFVFENADVNGDGEINLSDIILTVHIIMGTDLKTMDLGLESGTAHIYLNPNNITLVSDGTLAGLQFEIYGLFAEQLDLLIPGYELVTNIKNGKLMGLIFSMNNTPIPAGKIKLFNISESANDLAWGEVGAVNTVAQAVKVETHVLMAEEAFAFSAYPNPSNGLVYTEISLPHESMLVITIVDVTGKEVQVLHRGILSEGTYQFRNDANKLLSSGVYFLKAEAVSSATSEVFTKQVKIIVID
ncbi:MAG: dockerin type I domain-containing protein, partial [Bacteroidales bacterium]